MTTILQNRTDCGKCKSVKFCETSPRCREVITDNPTECAEELTKLIRAKSQMFYRKYIEQRLIEIGSTIIDSHAGNGTLYIIRLVNSVVSKMETTPNEMVGKFF